MYINNYKYSKISNFSQNHLCIFIIIYINISIYIHINI